MDKREEFYNKLKKQLNETSEFPTNYLFKFIVPSQGEGVCKVKEIFFEKEASVSTKKSKNGKYTSISISIKMDTADAIISKYMQADKIENIISL